MRSPAIKRAPAFGKSLGQCALALCLASGLAQAASLSGTVTNAAGEPLAKVPICLQAPDSGRQCVKVRSTDRKGGYQFTGLKVGVPYRVAIYQDDTASGRKFERYRTYVWEPLFQDVTLQRKNESQALAGFSGKFNFSNFQRGLTLTAADFPELSSLDLSADYVVLKVYIPAADPTTAPETIYLGQVASLDSLQIAASLPLSTTRIAYQIYSANLSIDGSIALTES